MEQVSLYLFKQNFKFSSAHFLIFDSKRAERLHGHNYRVKVSVHFNPNWDYSKAGLTIDFAKIKTLVKAQLDKWDEMVLLPKLQEDMHFTENGTSLEVRFRDRFYVFPRNEVVLLEVSNTSVENLSRLVVKNLLPGLKNYPISSISAYVEETGGQGASTRMKLD